MNLAASDVVQRFDACWEALLAEDNMTFTSTSDENKLKQQAAVLIQAYLGQLNNEPAPMAVETTLEEPLVGDQAGVRRLKADAILPLRSDELCWAERELGDAG